MSDEKVKKAPKLQPKIIARKLEIGEAYSYKELCELLNQPVYGGTQKKAQLKEFERYFAFERAKRKLIITDIYEVPLSKETRNSIYVQYIEKILLFYLSQQTGFKLIVTPKDLWEILGMVNSDYRKYENNYEDLCYLDVDMKPSDIEHFYGRIGQNLPKILDSALESLRKRCLIMYEHQYMIKKSDKPYKLANSKEKSYILECKKQALEQMELYSEQQVILKKRTKEYFEKINSNLRRYGYERAYKVYEIIYTKKYIQREINKEKKQLNEEIINRMNTQAENNVKRSEEMYYKLLQDENVNEFLPYYNVEYLFLQKLLSKRLLDISKENNQ